MSVFGWNNSALKICYFIFGGAFALSNFKWMPLACLDLSAGNLAAAEKLRKFGFVVNCSEFGANKYTKSSLAIYDVLANNKNPNVLIITNTSGLYGWYRVLVTSIGADFKVITGAPNPLVYFSSGGSGLYLVSSDTFFGDNVMKSKLSRSFLWDLVIIDEETNTNVPDCNKYRDNFQWATKRLMINSPFPAKTDEDKAAMAEFIKAVLDDRDLAAAASEMQFSRSAAGLYEDTPVMRYFDKSVYRGVARNVSFVEYTFDDGIINNIRRRVDLRSGLPAYRYGGNVFEGFDCEKFEKEKKIYLKPYFVRSDVEDLRAFDKKLDSFLSLCDRELADPESRMMVYCCDEHTQNYLNKALSCMYGADVRAAKEEYIHKGDIMRKLSADGKENAPRIIIGTDSLGSVGGEMDNIDNITCIVNYELPLSPVLLERRSTRHGGAGEAKRKFIIFRDTNKVFDSCVLDKVLYLKLGDLFCSDLPARNILLDIPEKGRHINELVADLKYIRDFAKQVDNCLDLIKKVKCEYSVPEAEAIGNSRQLADFANLILERLYKLLSIGDQSSEDDISAAVNALEGLCVLEDGRIVKVIGTEAMASSFEDDGYTNLPFASEAVKGLVDAKAEIDEYHKGENFHLKIKQEIIELEDAIQYPVLFGIWKYRAMEQDSARSFKDYIKIYNDGI